MTKSTDRRLNLETQPLRDADSVHELGSTLIIAPHPDDESLGCGGLIALLAQAKQPVHIAVMSDGSASHPASRAYPPDDLRRLRESETICAARYLGLEPEQVTFLRMRDTLVPSPESSDIADAVDSLRSVIDRVTPDTILLPWRRDPHSDHQATWHICMHAVRPFKPRPRTIEYPVWIWDLGVSSDAPAAGEMIGWRLDVSHVLEQKRAAIHAHQSQTTGLIDDDPSGFRLQSTMLERFQQPHETYLEPVHE
jgi:LmbE family N-acetylglucosaminyl deacetylase